MRRLDRYLLRELAIPLAYCLGGFLIFWISFDLFSNLDELQEGNRGAGVVALRYLYRLPEFLAFILPIGLLLAMLYGLSNHARHNEIVAMRTAGLSFWRITAPYLGAGLFFSLAVFALNEWAAPAASARAEALGLTAENSTNAHWLRQIHFQNAREGRFWTAAAYNIRTGEMQQPQVDWKDSSGARRRLFAQRGLYRNGAWIFEHAQTLTYPPGEEFEAVAGRTNLFISDFSEAPEEIEAYLKFAELTAVTAAKRAHFSLRELVFLRNSAELSPAQRAILETQFHARLAAPWTCLVVALVAIPIAATSSRRNAVVGVASSIAICFLYFVLMRLGLALSTSGMVPPWAGAWAPNAVFGAAGFLMTTLAR